MTAYPTSITGEQVKTVLNVLYAIGYGHIAGHIGTPEDRDICIQAAEWVEWLDGEGHLGA